MELPFAVESTTNGVTTSDTNVGGGLGTGESRINMNHHNTSSSSSSSLQQSESSLVTASSQGSFMNSSNGNHQHHDPDQHRHHHVDSPLPPNTPQDVVLPARYGINTTATSIVQQQQQSRQQNQHHHHHQPSQQQQTILHGQLVVTPPDHDIVKDCGYNTVGDANNHPDDDFAYVNVTEMDADDVDILLEGADGALIPNEPQRGDVLAVLLSGMQHCESDALMNQTEGANDAAMRASEAKKQGDLLVALEYHTQASKLYRDSAMSIRDRNSSLANSLLLLSQAQAKSALALKGIIKLNPAELRQVLPPLSRGNGGLDSTSAAISHKERLRAAVRGALGSRHPHEADISDSQFLGRATDSGGGVGTASNRNEDPRNDQEGGTLLTEGQDSSHSSSNPVDEMMELERELRDMDMALELGNSISSLDNRMQNRMKHSMIGDGSFMVVPPGSNSYMSSSMWGSGQVPNNSRPAPGTANNHGTAGVRARANRVQNILEASATPVNRLAYQPQPHVGSTNHMNKATAGLESSWWGNTSITSQILASSVVSLGGRTVAEGGHLNDVSDGPSSSASTKQLMRLMDSLKTLGDENAVLLREVEELEAARTEAKAAREQMKRFKADYGKRFATLKKALDKFRQDHPHGSNTSNNPVNSSDFIKSASVSDQIQRQEQLIRKLTADLKKEKEESKKKDAALRKYESFYREVKARSAQKAAQRQLGAQPQPQPQQQQQQQRQSTKSRTTPSRPTHR